MSLVLRDVVGEELETKNSSLLITYNIIGIQETAIYRIYNKVQEIKSLVYFHS
jgi:hypothetical protein